MTGDTNTDAEFMNELEAATRLRPSIASNLMLGSIAALVLFIILWASFAKIDEMTLGSGQVVPSQEIQVVQSLEGGILAELPVAEGDSVKKGQVLLRISDVNFSSEQHGMEAKQQALQAKKARLEAESKGAAFAMPADIAQKAPDIAANELALYKSRQQELANAVAIQKNRYDSTKSEIGETQAQITRLRNNMGLLNQELAITSKMVAQQAAPKIEEIRLQQQISESSGQLNALQQKLPGLQAELSAAEDQVKDANDKFRSQALGELGDTETALAQARESLKSMGDRVNRTELRSPVDGIVNNIAIKTIGGVIQPAQKLVEIVPIDSKLKIIARVLPSDIAFLKPGQPVRVKISAYDPQRYGALDGHLVRIGATSVTDQQGHVSFEIEVSTDKNHLGSDENPLPVTPGMVATTEVVTGRRTIMEYLMRPVLRFRDRAFRER
jgi:membrane fusion protein, adhesin transport system